MTRRTLVLWSTGLAAAACSGDGVQVLPPLGEVEIVVDTDMPVPRLVSRLRVDMYSEPDVRWIASRDFLRASPASWPTSFVVYSPDPDRAGSMLVRLRAYLDGKVRDYRGERYMEGPPQGNVSSVAALPDGANRPRLLDDSGDDITPLTEPQPLLTIDRLVRVTAVPGLKQRANVVLRGECVGVMADVPGGRTCVDNPAQRTSPDVTQVPRTTDALGPSVTGTFDAPVPCNLPTRSATTLADGTKLYDDEVCVPQGVFVFGWPEFAFDSIAQLGEPERMARVPAFRMDRNEVTVARWRRALTEGFSPATDAVAVNDAPLPTDPNTVMPGPYRTTQCTYSSAPMGRETYPLLCVTWAAAQAFCRFHGGDLPLEVEWAYAALAAARPLPTAYPWGGPDSDLASCSRAVFGRGLASDDVQADACWSAGFGFGPQPVEAGLGALGDISVGLGIENLGGSASEWMRDDTDPLNSICWMQNTLDLPQCKDPSSQSKQVRGGSWVSAPRFVPSARRDGAEGDQAQLDVGFRCVREAP
jgi:formylglycine-generating enzyme required for sulfatase activity